MCAIVVATDKKLSLGEDEEEKNYDANTFVTNYNSY